jgi:DNA replication licensing factor MCM4
MVVSFYYYRLHREALKQAATDPKTGIIDVGILTTGVSNSERQRRETLAKELYNLLTSKFKGGGLIKYAELFDAIKEQSQIVCIVCFFINNVKYIFTVNFSANV